MSCGSDTSAMPSLEPKKLMTSIPCRSDQVRTSHGLSGAEPEPICRSDEMSAAARIFSLRSNRVSNAGGATV
jgi:hypothetical protein